MRISDWSSDVCSSDLSAKAGGHIRRGQEAACRSHGGRPASCLSARTGIGGRRKSGTVRVSVARHFRILRASGAPARGPYPVLAPEPVDGAAMKPFSSWRRKPEVRLGVNEPFARFAAAADCVFSHADHFADIALGSARAFKI